MNRKLVIAELTKLGIKVKNNKISRAEAIKVVSLQLDKKVPTTKYNDKEYKVGDKIKYRGKTVTIVKIVPEENLDKKFTHYGDKVSLKLEDGAILETTLGLDPAVSVARLKKKIARRKRAISLQLSQPGSTSNDPWMELLEIADKIKGNGDFEGLEEFIDFVAEVWNGGVEQYIDNGHIKGIDAAKGFLQGVNKPDCNTLDSLIKDLGLRPSTKYSSDPSRESELDEFDNEFYRGLDKRVVKEVLDYVNGKMTRQTTGAKNLTKASVLAQLRKSGIVVTNGKINKSDVLSFIKKKA